MADLFENPVGTNGFDFVEYTGDTEQLDKIFKQFGFVPLAKHKTKDVVLYQQGDIRFLINAEKDGQAKSFRDEHNAGANAMGFRAHDADFAFK